MTKFFWNVFKLSPAVLAATFFGANSAFAEAIETTTSVAELSEESQNIGQVTSVSQFSDVQPTDWAFQALQSLVERYGCIAGYPNGTFRGNRALTRFEFAAGLNACLDRINELIAIATEQMNNDDLETLKRLQEEYAAELATLRGRVDALEFRTSELEANQFSTTTKLKGEVVIAASGARGDVNDQQVTLSSRTRLSFDSSFSGKDKLRVRLQARESTKFDGGSSSISSPRPNVTGTNMTRLGFDGDDGNNFELTELNYTFMPLSGVKVKIDANEADLNDNINVFNPVFKSSGGGAISRYGRFSPIYRTASNQAGATITLGGKKSPIKLSAAYTAGTDGSFVSQTGNNNGLFEGNNAVLGQIDFKPAKAFNLGFTYVRRYDDGTKNNLTGSTGSSLAKDPFDGDRTTSNNYGVQGSLKLSKKIILGGWYGFADAENVTDGNGEADIDYWGATLGFKDFIAKGNTLGIIFGQPPKVTEINNVTDAMGTTVTKDKDTSYHLEGLYKMKLNNNIAITPGLLVIFNPEHDDTKDTIYVGTLRTTFKF